MGLHLAKDMQQLHKQILSMAALVEQMVHEAVENLRQPNQRVHVQLAAQEKQIDQLDVQIENACLTLLAIHRPVAGELRRIATVLKISGELERVADFTVNLAERANELCQQPKAGMPEKLLQMASIAREMLREAMDSFVEADGHLARRVCLRDDEVDQLNVQLIQELIVQMEKCPAQIRSAMQLFSAARYLERVADHATNIAEEVVFLVEGQIIRHQPKPPSPGFLPNP